MELRLDSVSSTQEAAADLPVGSVVVADHQTRGRGRLGRSWEAPARTGLLATFVLAPNLLASIAAGVAAAEACGAAVRLKWPNDLLLRGRKLGGILVEARPGRALVGVGINLRWAPAGGARLDVERDALLDHLREALDRYWRLPAPSVLQRWRDLSETLGSEVRVTLPDGFIEGLAEDISADGALVVSGRTVAAGDVIHLRRAPAASAAPPRSDHV